MELGFLIVVILLFLAAIDLTVGVSNDAVNFINCAYGSNAGSLKKILFIGALGVLVGVLCSGGMLEVARKGVFYPNQFVMIELLIIFIAVMFGDIILLDIFNTYGMPTSTTVSIVFGLTGAAISMSLIKLNAAGESFNLIGEYINIPNVLKIILGIFLSILIAFIAGTFIQYLTRLIFTFDYKARFKKFGGIWGSIVVTVLSAFIIFKGAKHANFIPADILTWLHGNFWLFIGLMFVFWLVLLQILIVYTKTNILKGIVLFGTFALAMAFAANDLVNFIGAPIAGLTAYDLADGTLGNPFASLHTGNPLASMAQMNAKVPANNFILVAAAGIMIVTLYTSKKALRVVRTGIDLGKQGDASEKFESNMLGRFIVRAVIDFAKLFNRFIPQSFSNKIKDRFDISKYQPEYDKSGNEPSFDLIRASVILFVSASVITLATSMKLPLSTTYVTFIAAMAAALPDKAWGRESAVYRVSGVLTVIGGWFFTAFFAALLSFILVLIINWGGAWAIGFFTLLIVFLLVRSSKKVKSKTEEDLEHAHKISTQNAGETKEASINLFLNDVQSFMLLSQDSLSTSIKGLSEAKLEKLKKGKKLAAKSEQNAGDIKVGLMNMMNNFTEADPKINYAHSKAMIIIQDISDRINSIARKNYKYINNNHNELLESQVNELSQICNNMNDIITNTANMIAQREFDEENQLKTDIKKLREHVKEFNKSQIARQQEDKIHVRRSMLYTNMLFEINTLCDTLFQLYAISKKVYKQNVRLNAQ